MGRRFWTTRCTNHEQRRCSCTVLQALKRNEYSKIECEEVYLGAGGQGRGVWWADNEAV